MSPLDVYTLSVGFFLGRPLLRVLEEVAAAAEAEGVPPERRSTP
jgi:hypothetical protein